jgi:iron complex outermembrane receptor protein
VQTVGEFIPYTETGLPLQAAIDACESSPTGYGASCNEDLEWNVSSPVNGPGGDLDGYEISYQQPFTFLPGIGSNFGAIINLTHVESQVDYLTAANTLFQRNDLINLSEESSNFTLYYEDETFSVRVSMASRDNYITQVPGRDGNFIEEGVETTNIDLSASFTLNESLKFTFEGLNLTDEAEIQTIDSILTAATATEPAVGLDANYVHYYHQTGKQYFLGARYSFN